MRHLIDSELAAVAEEASSGGLTWCQRDVGRLTTPYPSRKDVDRVLEALGDDFYHDEIHDIDAEAAEVSDGSSDERDAQGAPTGRAGDGGANGADDEGANAAVADDACTELARVQDQTPLTASQVDMVHQLQTSSAAMELATEGLRSAGQLQAARAVELELEKENGVIGN